MHPCDDHVIDFLFFSSSISSSLPRLPIFNNLMNPFASASAPSSPVPHPFLPLPDFRRDMLSLMYSRLPTHNPWAKPGSVDPQDLQQMWAAQLAAGLNPALLAARNATLATLPPRSDVTPMDDDVMASTGFRGRSGSDVTAGSSRRKSRPTHTLTRPPSLENLSDRRQPEADVTPRRAQSGIIEIAPIGTSRGSPELLDLHTRRPSPPLTSTLKPSLDDVIRRKRDAAAVAADRACPDIESKVSASVSVDA